MKNANSFMDIPIKYNNEDINYIILKNKSRLVMM